MTHRQASRDRSPHPPPRSLRRRPSSRRLPLLPNCGEQPNRAERHSKRTLFTEALTVAAHANLSVFLICIRRGRLPQIPQRRGAQAGRRPDDPAAVPDAHVLDVRRVLGRSGSRGGARRSSSARATCSSASRSARSSRGCCGCSRRSGSASCSPPRSATDGALPFILSLVVAAVAARRRHAGRARVGLRHHCALRVGVDPDDVHAGAKYIQYATSSLEAPPAADAKGKVPDPAPTLRARVLRRIKSVEPTVAGTVLGIIIEHIPPLKAILGAGGARASSAGRRASSATPASRCRR